MSTLWSRTIVLHVWPEIKWNNLVSGLPAKLILRSKWTKEELISSSCLGRLRQRLTEHSNQETQGNHRMAREKEKEPDRRWIKTCPVNWAALREPRFDSGNFKTEVEVALFYNMTNQPETKLSTITAQSGAFQGDLDTLIQQKSFQLKQLRAIFKESEDTLLQIFKCRTELSKRSMNILDKMWSMRVKAKLCLSLSEVTRSTEV